MIPFLLCPPFSPVLFPFFLLSIPPSPFTLRSFSILLLSTELQNYRLIEVRRNLWRSSYSTSLLKQGHLEPVLRIMSIQLLNVFRNGDSTTSVGKLCQCLVTLTAKSVYWCAKGIFCVSICAHYLWSCYWAPSKSLALSSLCLPVRYL